MAYNGYNVSDMHTLKSVNAHECIHIYIYMYSYVTKHLLESCPNHVLLTYLTSACQKQKHELNSHINCDLWWQELAHT